MQVSPQMFQAMVEGSFDAYLFADHDGVIRMWNAAAERLFGFSAAEAIGQTLDLIVPERSRAQHWDGYKGAVARGDHKYTAELLAAPSAHKGGERISLEFSVTMLKDGGGAVLGMAACFRDVTEKRARERTMRERIAELEKAAES